MDIYPNLDRLLAAAEPIERVVKNFRHEGQYFSIIEKDKGPFKKKLYIFQIDGEDFAPDSGGWESAQDTMNAIKEFVRHEH